MSTPDEDLYECECGASKRYRDEINEMPEGWFRLEDRGCVWVLCSVRCLADLARALATEPPR